MRISNGSSIGLGIGLATGALVLIVGVGGVAGAAPAAQAALAGPASIPAADFAVAPVSALAPADATIGSAQDGATIPLTLGQTLAVNLAGNATTGFDWKLQGVDRTILHPDGDVTYTPTGYDPPLTGSGGIFTARFTAVRAGETLVSLVYVRPFESHPAKPFFVHVVVASAPGSSAVSS